ncbi:hypothetical protein ACLF3G_29035, partial [Falsiroseomonas sp. HC035]|uniref:hypothetical protein n=1 Tax=Falsiroseomonas sp. HC035 TaxID=3390999 RepID=UPI003D31B78D
TNLAWVSPKTNNRLAAKFHNRAGAKNPAAKADVTDLLPLFLEHYDGAIRAHRRPDLDYFSKVMDVSVRQLRRLAKEQCRRDEVRAIREEQRLAREKKAAEEAKLLKKYDGNPFFAE